MDNSHAYFEEKKTEIEQNNVRVTEIFFDFDYCHLMRQYKPCKRRFLLKNLRFFFSISFCIQKCNTLAMKKKDNNTVAVENHKFLTNLLENDNNKKKKLNWKWRTKTVNNVIVINTSIWAASTASLHTQRERERYKQRTNEDKHNFSFL